jgi:hypothetical protein
MRPGDRLRTGSRSRAILRGPDASLLRLNEMTTFDLNSPATNKPGLPELRLHNGNFYRFNRDGGTNALPLITPHAKGTIRG